MVLASICITIEIELLKIMSTNLRSPEADLRSHKDEVHDNRIKKNVEQEIECPRCADIMTLSSEFDKLGYVCHECDLLLVMK
jgi:hypothetical protein